jgi:hypothetical protein
MHQKPAISCASLSKSTEDRESFIVESFKTHGSLCHPLKEQLTAYLKAMKENLKP